MIGVYHPIYTKKNEVWENKCSSNTPNITNHYIVIKGKKYDKSKKQYYYLFYEVGTSNENNGKSSENRLYIDNSSNIIKGKTAYKAANYFGDYYIVTEVRKNIGQTY
jgi:predicted small secreted protein